MLGAAYLEDLQRRREALERVAEAVVGQRRLYDGLEWLRWMRFGQMGLELLDLPRVLVAARCVDG